MLYVCIYLFIYDPLIYNNSYNKIKNVYYYIVQGIYLEIYIFLNDVGIYYKVW